jgi:2-polyprenyl-3-methyl-5-hydroxy-6-metoxy-1,4-benzoquinol methylase
METVLSPVTHKPAVKINSIPTRMIIDLYQEDTAIDVSGYFKGMDHIDVYQCQQTGYRFFYPLTLAGNDVFYEQLQKYDWYYADWKWDYDAAFPFITEGSKVLDIGCGSGNFLAKLKSDKNCDCTGLEFNDKAIEAVKAKGIPVHKEFIQDYAAKHKNEYDIVCYFQVLEHISDIDSFVAASIECLKPGGKLIICVPNNNPHFIGYYEYHSLNMPPHHMGLWNRESFEGLTKIYPLQLKDVKTEKLNRFRNYTKYFIEYKSKDNPSKKALMNFFKFFMTGYFVLNRKNIEAGSILVVYEKK